MSPDNPMGSDCIVASCKGASRSQPYCTDTHRSHGVMARFTERTTAPRHAYLGGGGKPCLTQPPTKSCWVATTERNITSKGAGMKHDANWCGKTKRTTYCIMPERCLHPARHEDRQHGMPTRGGAPVGRGAKNMGPNLQQCPIGRFSQIH